MVSIDVFTNNGGTGEILDCSQRLACIFGVQDNSTKDLIVTLDLLDAPTQVTSTVDPPYILYPGKTAHIGTYAASDHSVLRLSVGSTAAIGRYDLTVRGSNSLMNELRDPLTLTVVAPFTFAPTNAVSVVNGSTSAQAEVQLARQGLFTGPVDVTVDANAFQITALPATIASSGTSAAVTLSIPSTITIGSHAVVLRGRTPARVEETVSLTVDISGPPSNSASFVLSLFPSSLTVPYVSRGSSAPLQVTVTPRNGFLGVVNIAIVDNTQQVLPPEAKQPGFAPGCSSAQLTADLNAVAS